MATPIVAFPTMRRYPDASAIEQTAKNLAVASGVLATSQPLACLPTPEARKYRSRARMALSGRTFSDCKLFAREQYAQAVYGPVFRALTPEAQTEIADLVELVLGAAQIYLEGIAEPLNAETRAWAMTDDERLNAGIAS